MQKPFHLAQLAGAVIGAAAGNALAAGGAAALTTEGELTTRFIGVSLVAGAVGGALGDLLGFILDDASVESHGRLAGLTALVVSGLTAGPMLLVVFILLFEKWFDITPLVGEVAAFTGFMAGATGRLMTILIARVASAANRV
jgi:hypothetical protein